MLKTCSKCGQNKDSILFDRSSSRKDGFHSSCKLCESKRQALKYKKNKDKIEARNDSWKEKNRLRIREYNKKHYEVNSTIYRARNLLNSAIARGAVKKSVICSMCGGTAVHGHHEDYSKPLDVIWLCMSCHKRRHAILRELKYSPVEL